MHVSDFCREITRDFETLRKHKGSSNELGLVVCSKLFHFEFLLLDGYLYPGTSTKRSSFRPSFCPA